MGLFIGYSEISGNQSTAGSAGGIYVDNESGYAQVLLATNSTIAENSAAVDGGGMYADGAGGSSRGRRPRK